MESKQLSLNLKFYKVEETKTNPTPSKPEKILKVSPAKAKEDNLKQKYILKP